MADEASRASGWKFHGMKTAHLHMGTALATVCGKNVYPAAGVTLALAVGPRCKKCRKSFAIHFGEIEAAKTDPTEPMPPKPRSGKHVCSRAGCETPRAFGRSLCSQHHAEVYPQDVTK